VADGVATDYAGNYIYENSSLKFINHPEGYIEPDGAGGYEYVYQHKDHLGNVRVSYSDSNGDGVVDVNEILSEKNYYPFGLTHRGYNNQTQGTYYPYGFGGKEEQQELDLNWLDFSARNYDPALGRWMNIDLLADANGQIHNAPYNYALNNPVVLTDPDGNCPPGVDCYSVVMGVFNTAKNYYSSVARGFSNTINATAEGVKQLASDFPGTVKAAAADHLDRVTNPSRLIGDTVDAVSMVNPTVAMMNDAAMAMTSDDPVAAMGEAQGSRLADQTMAAAGEGAGAALGRGVSLLKNVGKVSDAVTESTVAKALEGSTMKTIQSEVSLPVVKRYVDKLEAGETAPPIKVDNGVIVDGNHRFVAGRIYGKEPATVPGVVPRGLKPLIRPVTELKVNSIDYGNN